MAQGLRGFAGLGTVWMCAWGYAAWATPTDLSSMVLASMALMWFSSGGEGNEAVPADARQIGLAMGWMLMGPTALSLPIGYGFGVWASPDGGVGPQD